jgi:ATP synthase protein I
MQKKEKKESIKRLALLSTVGINLVVSSVLGFFIGRWLDEYFETSPWLTIVFFILGITSGFIYLVRISFKNNDSFSG